MQKGMETSGHVGSEIKAALLAGWQYSLWSNAPILYITEWNFSNFIHQALK
jgi:hypothetical protein